MGFGLGSIAGPVFDLAKQGWANYEAHRAQGIAQGQAQNQMDFQERMSNTAHQREVEDLKKAGLNPILSAGGQGSSSPSGSAAPIATPTINMPDFMAYGVSLKRLEQMDRQLDIEGAKATAQIANTVSDTELNELKKVLLNKGMPKAMLEGEAAKVLRNIIKELKKNVTQPKLPAGQNFDNFQPGNEGVPLNVR